MGRSIRIVAGNNMQFDDLLKFIKLTDKRLRDQFNNYSDEEKRILVRTVKLTEEVGELCDAVLTFNSMQRSEKLEKYNPDNLPHEFADVVITTLLLAEVMGVDIEKALESKIEKINKRYEK